jgi:hypothetical protein
MSSTQYRIPVDPFLTELENISQKFFFNYPKKKRQRHGLFTQPPPLLIGSKFNDTAKSRQPTSISYVEPSPRGVLVAPSIKKNFEPALFKDPQYISISIIESLLTIVKDDPYKEAFKRKQI